MPVVVADLHSALPAVLAGLRSERPEARVVYLMTDGGALPIAFSRTVAGLRDAGWLHGTVTVGQAYGGEHEAVTLHSGLLAARHVLGADVAVVIQGPGNVGTGTTWGYTGVAAGEALNAVGVLRGRGVAALRVSDADPRGRHRGISHHSRTAYGRVVPGRGGRAGGGWSDDEFGRLVPSRPAPWSRTPAATWRCARSTVDGLDGRCAPPRSGSRPWAAGSTRTTRRSCTAQQPGGGPPGCWKVVPAEPSSAVVREADRRGVAVSARPRGRRRRSGSRPA